MTSLPMDVEMRMKTNKKKDEQEEEGEGYFIWLSSFFWRLSPKTLQERYQSLRWGARMCEWKGSRQAFEWITEGPRLNSPCTMSKFP